MSEPRDFIHDAYTRAVMQADQRGQYIKPEVFSKLKEIMREKNRRFDIVRRLRDKTDDIVLNAARKLFRDRPHLVLPGGNAYPNRRNQACIRDMDFLLKYVTLSFLCGDPSILTIRCLDGLKETYKSLGTPREYVAESVENMWEEAIKYLDHEKGDNPSGWEDPYKWSVSPASEYGGSLPNCSDLYSELKTYFDIARDGV